MILKELIKLNEDETMKVSVPKPDDHYEQYEIANEEPEEPPFEAAEYIFKYFKAQPKKRQVSFYTTEGTEKGIIAYVAKYYPDVKLDFTDAYEFGKVAKKLKMKKVHQVFGSSVGQDGEVFYSDVNHNDVLWSVTDWGAVYLFFKADNNPLGK